MEYEFTKILVKTVVQMREGGKVVGENIGDEIPFYTAGSVAEFMAQMERETAKVNAAQGNRQQKRATTKKSSAKKGSKKGGKES